LPTAVLRSAGFRHHYTTPGQRTSVMTSGGRSVPYVAAAHIYEVNIISQSQFSLQRLYRQVKVSELSCTYCG